MWWLLIIFCVLLSVCGVWFVSRIQSTALLVVHPWNFGLTQAEMEANLKSFQQGGFVCTNETGRRMIEKHLNYYQILERYIGTQLYGHLILFEEQGREEISLLRIKMLLERNFLPPILSKMLKVSFELKINVVSTVRGCATPAGEVHWRDIANSMHRNGIRRVHIVGSYLGLIDQQIVFDPKRYGNYCVNEVFAVLQISELFDEVSVLPHLCYEQVAQEHQGDVCIIESRRKKKSKKRRKK